MSRNGVQGRIVRVRHRQGLSQRQVAAIAGLSPTHISRIESGERNPSEATVRAIAKALGTTEHYLLTGDSRGAYVYVTRDEIAEGIGMGESLAARIAAETPELQLEGSTA